MPYAFPSHIKEWLQTYTPPTHKMWWMRTEIVNLEQRVITVRNENIDDISQMYLRLLARDIDAPKNTKNSYEVDILLDKYKDYRLGDRLSMFGHEPVSATHLSLPRRMCNHETRVEGPCYPAYIVDTNRFPQVDYIVYLPSNPSIKAWEKATNAKRKLFGNFNLLPLYEALACEMDKYVRTYPDPNYSCVNPRLSRKGGELVD